MNEGYCSGDTGSCVDGANDDDYYEDNGDYEHNPNYDDY